MYDLDKVKAEYPAVEWTADMIETERGPYLDLTGKTEKGGLVVEVPKGVADGEGLTRAARSLIAAMRHKGYYPQTAFAALVDGKTAEEAVAAFAGEKLGA